MNEPFLYNTYHRWTLKAGTRWQSKITKFVSVKFGLLRKDYKTYDGVNDVYLSKPSSWSSVRFILNDIVCFRN
jgi:hypothetical protein